MLIKTGVFDNDLLHDISTIMENQFKMTNDNDVNDVRGGKIMMYFYSCFYGNYPKKYFLYMTYILYKTASSKN